LRNRPLPGDAHQGYETSLLFVFGDFGRIFYFIFAFSRASIDN